MVLLRTVVNSASSACAKQEAQAKHGPGSTEEMK